LAAQLKNSKYSQLRYLKHGKNLYTWDAAKGTHGTVADHLGLSRHQWNHATLTGFVKPPDLTKIGKTYKDFRHWVAQRHAAARHSIHAASHSPPWSVGSYDGHDVVGNGRYVSEQYLNSKGAKT
jgi:hypothetical protein